MRIKRFPGSRIKSDYMGRTSPGLANSVERRKGFEVAALSRGVSGKNRWGLGGCPRCAGDVLLESEDGELLAHCLQCGYVGIRRVATKSRAGSK